MKQFQLQLFNGHPIIYEGENKILLDTGAPSTIHASDRLNFLSESFECSTNYMGLTVSEISDMLGTEITTLLGADIVSTYKILLAYQDQLVGFSKQQIDIDGTQADISNFMGIPIIKLTVDNQELKFFLDTGAKLSYVSDSLTNTYESVGTDEDFYPGVGRFQTECFEIPTVFGGKEFSVKYGNLPTLLQMTLLLGGTDGFIGFDFFDNFKVVLDLKNNVLEYAR
ncbi:hypothetical protein [Cyclobacterium xiamenense]|uniref:hypothetical protein n=1 Tax=Cyclobacterium xiamenense TaxID=1297121 RepID=UPI0012B72475|nr:hypothetical protein [Cyclobacterium xiamenense]